MDFCWLIYWRQIVVIKGYFYSDSITVDSGLCFFIVMILICFLIWWSSAVIMKFLVLKSTLY